MKNYQILSAGLFFLFISWSILTGFAQQWVHFAGVDNEMFCFIISFTMGILCIGSLDWKGMWKWLIK